MEKSWQPLSIKLDVRQAPGRAYGLANEMLSNICNSLDVNPSEVFVVGIETHPSASVRSNITIYFSLFVDESVTRESLQPYIDEVLQKAA